MTNALLMYAGVALIALLFALFDWYTRGKHPRPRTRSEQPR